MGAPFPKIAHGIWTTHVIHGSLGPPESSTQTTSRSVQPCLQGLLTDRLTDHSTQSVTIGRIYVGSTAMQPNNTMQRLMHRVSAVKRWITVMAVKWWWQCVVTVTIEKGLQFASKSTGSNTQIVSNVTRSDADVVWHAVWIYATWTHFSFQESRIRLAITVKPMSLEITGLVCSEYFVEDNVGRILHI